MCVCVCVCVCGCVCLLDKHDHADVRKLDYRENKAKTKLVFDFRRKEAPCVSS